MEMSEAGEVNWWPEVGILTGDRRLQSGLGAGNKRNGERILEEESGRGCEEVCTCRTKSGLPR